MQQILGHEICPRAPRKGSTPTLGYLFEAEFEDGTKVTQTQADVSVLLPPDENGNGKSAFYDVRMRLEEVTKFSLIPTAETRKNGGRKISLDLKTGNFRAFGTIHTLKQQFLDENPGFEFVNPLRLVYWRDCRAEIKTSRDAAPEVTKHCVTKYHLGWQTVGVDGLSYKCIMTVEGD